MTEFNLKDINQKLHDISGAKDNTAEQQALSSRLAELQESQGHLSGVQGKIDTLKRADADGGSEISIPMNIDTSAFQNVRGQLEDTTEKFNSDPTNDALMGGNRWSNLGGLIKSNCANAISTFEADWKNFVEEFLAKGRQPPESLD